MILDFVDGFFLKGVERKMAVVKVDDQLTMFLRIFFLLGKERQFRLVLTPSDNTRVAALHAPH